jgi:hypothetical protein
MGTTNTAPPAPPAPAVTVSGHPTHHHIRRPLSPREPNRFLHEIEVHEVVDPSAGFEVVFEPQAIDEVLIALDADAPGAPTCALVGDTGELEDLRLVAIPGRAGYFHAMVGGDAGWSRLRVRPSSRRPANLLHLKFIGRPVLGYVRP